MNHTRGLTWRRACRQTAAAVTLVVLLMGFTGCTGVGRAATAQAGSSSAAPTGPAAAAPEPPTGAPSPGQQTGEGPAGPDLVPYDGPVENLFFHPLVVYPERAFDGDSLSQGYDDWFVTVPEFKNILEALYRNGYVLIDIRDLYDLSEQDGKTLLERRQLRVPRGRKPLILSVDDLNYYDYMRDNGNARRLVLNAEGDVAAESTNALGQTVVSTDDEVIPILDAFVREHPEFSLRGARGVIALTGYQGILGYGTHEPKAPGYEAERQDALRVAARLKATGWVFASHGWGHLPLARISQGVLQRDTERWKDQVEPLAGSTPIYVFPHGSRVPMGDAKMHYLEEQGFRVFLSVGPSPYLESTRSYLLMDRRHIDGIALRTQRRLLLPLFDAKQVIDSRRPAPAARPPKPDASPAPPATESPTGPAPPG